MRSTNAGIGVNKSFAAIQDYWKRCKNISTFRIILPKLQQNQELEKTH